MKCGSNGFTIVEISIVLVITGLLLSGVVKGQELISNARVRNFISQQEAVRVAFYGFQDRYRALPGDYAMANTNIACPGACLEGNGNGRIESSATSGVTHEEILAWSHLAGAGFLTASFSMVSPSVSLPDDDNTPKNPYGVYLQLIYDNNWGQAGNPLNRYNLKTGSQVPVEIMAEVDRKIDDGRPYSGSFQFSAYAAPASGAAPDPATCVSGGAWNVAGGDANCGATSLL